MFSLHPTQVGQETENVNAIFLCAKAGTSPKETESLDSAILQYHFRSDTTTPLFVLLVETTQPCASPLRGSHSGVDRTTSLARSVHARDIYRISVPYGDSRVATIASSGTLESHGILENVAISLVEFHSPVKRARKVALPLLDLSVGEGLLGRGQHGTNLSFA